jgi:tetratricopeptide (TPR) repeat protein
MSPATDPPAHIASERPRRRLYLFAALLLLVLAVYAATAPFRAGVWERIWGQRQAVEWARQEQERALAQRRLRASLRDQLRRLAQEPEDFDALMKAASYSAQLRRYDEALFMLSEAERLRPRDSEVCRAQGEAYLSSGQYDRCIESLERGLRLAPDDMELNLMRVDLDAILGWISDARPRVQRLITLFGSREARVHLMAALIERQEANARESEHHLREAIRLDPNNDKVYALLSGLEWELGHRASALQLIEKALAINPNHADYYIHLGEIQRGGPGQPAEGTSSPAGRRPPGTMPPVSSGRSPEAARLAERSYRRALELEPASQQAKYGLAVCRLTQGDPEGQTMLEQLLKINPYLPAPMLELGNLYTRQGRREEGAAMLARYQKSVRENSELKGLSLRMAMQPKNAATYREMGELHLRTGYPQKAIAVLRRSLQLDPRDESARRLLSESLAEAGRAGEIDALLAHP